MQIARFMASPVGRITRVIAGVILIALGLVIGGPVGWTIAVVGLVPIAAGVGNVCLLAPALRVPFRGSDIQ